MPATAMPVTEIPAAEPSPIPQASVTALRVLPVLLAPPRSTYSIRLADESGTACFRCDKPTGAGPIGDLAGSPLCDDYLMSDCYELGVVLATVAFVRGFGSADPDDRAVRDHALATLARFADVFEQVAAAWGHRASSSIPRSRRSREVAMSTGRDPVDRLLHRGPEALTDAEILAIVVAGDHLDDTVIEQSEALLRGDSTWATR